MRFKSVTILIITAIFLSFLVGILLIQLKKETSCGVFLKSKISKKLKIIDKDKWQKYYQELLPCQNNLITIYSPSERRNLKVKQIRFVLTDRNGLTKTKRWQDRDMYFEFDSETDDYKGIFTYYLNPKINENVNPETVNFRMGITIHSLLVAIKPAELEEKDGLINDWLNQGKTLADIGLIYEDE
jgi:hypothetical protein